MTEELNEEVYQEILDKGSLGDRIARKALVELVRNNVATFLFIRDEEVRDYWTGLVVSAKDKIERRRLATIKYENRLSAWNKLSDDERKILKLAKPTKPRI